MSADMSNGTLSALIDELIGLQKQCAEQMDVIESSVLNWIHDDGEISKFPLVDFQRLDFVQQLQNDIISVLDFVKNIEVNDMHLTAEICQSVLSASKLEFTKMHVAMCFPDDLKDLQNLQLGDRETSDFEAF